MLFYNQPLAHRFGEHLAANLKCGSWTDFESAVAWVRRSGTSLLENPFRTFLNTGSTAKITVGLDAANTSEEGLRDLLSWQSEGNIEIFVYHNEASSIFHPKVYLFTNTDFARLIVGSNNLTAAGLYINTEAGLQIDDVITSDIIRQVKVSLSAWRDTTTGLALLLNDDLLCQLVANGYVYSEQQISRTNTRNRSQAQRQVHLFRRLNVTAPLTHTQLTSTYPTIQSNVLVMRVRRASERERRTQIQLPFRVTDSNLFIGITYVISLHDSRQHNLIEATARGGRNTIKVEIPEIDTMVEPLVRFQRVGNDVHYLALNTVSSFGHVLYNSLLAGFNTTPPTTFQTISDRARATWWQFI
jgi:HKD family nuclease